MTQPDDTANPEEPQYAKPKSWLDDLFESARRAWLAVGGEPEQQYNAAAVLTARHADDDIDVENTSIGDWLGRHAYKLWHEFRDVRGWHGVPEATVTTDTETDDEPTVHGDARNLHPDSAAASYLPLPDEQATDTVTEGQTSGVIPPDQTASVTTEQTSPIAVNPDSTTPESGDNAVTPQPAPADTATASTTATPAGGTTNDSPTDATADATATASEWDSGTS